MNLSGIALISVGRCGYRKVRTFRVPNRFPEIGSSNMTPDSRANSQRLSQSALRPRGEQPWGIPHRVAKLQEPSLSPDGRLWFAMMSCCK